MSGETSVYDPAVVEASKRFIDDALERSDGENPLHLVEIVLFTRENCETLFQDLRELILADGRIRQESNYFKRVPNTEKPAAPVADNTDASDASAPAASGASVAAPVESSTDPVQNDEANASQPANTAAPEAQTWTPLPIPESTEPLVEEELFLYYVSTVKAVRTAGVSTEEQFIKFVHRYCDQCPPMSPFREWWRRVMEAGTLQKHADEILNRLAFLQLVHVKTMGQRKRLMWDLNALAKYAAEHNAKIAKSTAPQKTAWNPTEYASDLASVKKMILHHLKLFAFYRVQNIRGVMTKKLNANPNFDVDLYVETLVGDIERDKRFLYTRDEANNPAFTWADKTKRKSTLPEPAQPHLTPSQIRAAAERSAPMVKNDLERDGCFPLGVLRRNMMPNGVKDTRDWIDAVVAVLEGIHGIRVTFDDQYLRWDRNSRHDAREDDRNDRNDRGKRARESTDFQDAGQYGSDSFYFQDDPAPKRRRLHDVHPATMEWYEPLQIELPGNIGQRPSTQETPEYNLQEQRRVYTEQGKEMPHQSVPNPVMRHIALDFEE